MTSAAKGTPVGRVDSPHFRNVVGSTISPAFKTPRGVPINDDEAERRIRRREHHLRSAVSPGCHTPRSVARNPEGSRTLESGTSTFTNAQIAEHYSVCVKLSAENKINAKNAFGLHLIDYMAEMLRKRGEMTNFQVAGCTLDASAKIYAGRVDSIYNDAFKMLGGLGRTDRQGDDYNDEDGEEGAAPSSQGAAKKKTRKTTAAPVIEKNVKSLDVNTFDLEFEVDPLFKKTSAAFDEGGVEGLLLNQLRVDSDQCTLLLDATHKLSVTDRQAPSHPAITGPDINEYFKTLQKVQDLRICPTFANFMFSEDNAISSWSRDGLLSSSSTDYCPPADADYSQLDLGPPPGDDDYHDSGVEDFVPEPYPVSSPQLPTETNRDLLKQRHDHIVAAGLTDTIEVSEYSYFNPTVLSAWAGPEHWKLRPRRQNNPADTNDRDIEEKNIRNKKREIRKAFRVDLSVTPAQELFVKGRASTTMSKLLLERMAATQTVLPHAPLIDQSVLHQLFCKSKIKIKRIDRTVDACELSDVGDFYANDSVHDAADEYFGEEAPNSIADPTQLSGAQFMSMLAGGQEDHIGLIDEPQKVAHIAIDYAKQAKKIDVKKLKGMMWSTISKECDQEEESTLSFSSLYSNIKCQSSASTANELSVPISFVCLLHLANEKSLRISGQRDMTDFTISLTCTS